MLARSFGVAGMVLLACVAKGDVAAKYTEHEGGGVKNGVFEDDYLGSAIGFRPAGWRT